RFVDPAMNKSFEIQRATVGADRIPVQGEFHNIVALDQLRTARPCQQIVLGMLGMAHTDVAVGIYHAFVGEDAVGDHELANVEVQVAHSLFIQRGVDIVQRRRVFLPYSVLSDVSSASHAGACAHERATSREEYLKLRRYFFWVKGWRGLASRLPATAGSPRP